MIYWVVEYEHLPSKQRFEGVLHGNRQEAYLAGAEEMKIESATIVRKIKAVWVPSTEYHTP